MTRNINRNRKLNKIDFIKHHRWKETTKRGKRIQTWNKKNEQNKKKCILIIDCIDYDSSLFESSWSLSSFELNVVEFSFVHWWNFVFFHLCIDWKKIKKFQIGNIFRFWFLIYYCFDLHNFILEFISGIIY